MATRDDILKEAREWLGTRWMHQQSIKGAACDCIGLVRGVGSSLGLLPKNYLSMAARFQGYGRRPDGRLLSVLDMFLDKVEVNLPGDVFLMEFDKNPQHVGFFTDTGIIHAHVMCKKVVEHRIDKVWQDRIIGIYRFRGIQ
jgi:NlpC/P60 family putative phage cell wall peptidase